MVPQALLFVPGDQAHRVRKALHSNAGTVVLDLEDGVAPTAKEGARAIVAEALRNPPEGKRLIVRCNAADSPEFSRDLEWLAFNAPHAVMLSKCEAACSLAGLEKAYPKGEVIPLLETALGIHRLEAIAEGSPRVRQVAFGSVDFALDLLTPWTPGGDERRYAMGRIVLVSRALGLLPPIDAVFPDLDDRGAFEADARLGRRIGFGSKMVIHPKQVDWLRDIYRPTEAEIHWSRQVVETFEQAETPGALQLSGRLIDRPVYEQARQLLASLDAN